MKARQYIEEQISDEWLAGHPLEELDLDEMEAN